MFVENDLMEMYRIVMGRRHCEMLLDFWHQKMLGFDCENVEVIKCRTDLLRWRKAVMVQ